MAAALPLVLLLLLSLLTLATAASYTEYTEAVVRSAFSTVFGSEPLSREDVTTVVHKGVTYAVSTNRAAETQSLRRGGEVEDARKRDATSYNPPHINHRQAQETTCSVSLYHEWQLELYTGVLSVEQSFWRYQTKPVFILTNELALELAVAACGTRFDHLYKFRAGKIGPITIQDSYKVMCKEDCLESDKIHESAMAYSGCSCLDLSTQEDEETYTVSGDWCMHNTAKLLCAKIGFCGVWTCSEEDFMCARYEWNKMDIQYKGAGTCIRGAAAASALSLATLALATALCLSSSSLLWLM